MHGEDMSQMVGTRQQAGDSPVLIGILNGLEKNLI